MTHCSYLYCVHILLSLTLVNPETNVINHSNKQGVKKGFEPMLIHLFFPIDSKKYSTGVVSYKKHKFVFDFLCIFGYPGSPCSINIKPRCHLTVLCSVLNTKTET